MMSRAGLNDLKLKYGLMDQKTYEEVMKHMEAAKLAIEAMTMAFSLPEPQRDEAIEKLRDDVKKANVDSLFSKNELEWHSASGLRFSFRLFRILASGFAQEIIHNFYRLEGKYDTSL